MQQSNSTVRNASLVEQFVSTSLLTSTVGEIGRKIFSFIKSPPVPQDDNALDQETAENKALQSAKIQLRLLAREQNYEEILRIAEHTPNHDIVSIAVGEIAHAPQHTVDNIALLSRLARSDSRASIIAIIALMNMQERQLAEEIFYEQVANGTWQALVRDGKAKLFSILDVSGCLDDIYGTAASLSYFDALWRYVPPDLTSQSMMIAEVLGDPEPGGFRYIYETNSIMPAVKMRTLAILEQLHPTLAARPFWYATRCEDDNVAYRSSVWLINYWQSAGYVPADLEFFPMLDVNLLFYLCQLSASFRWREPARVEEIFQHISQDNEAIEKLEAAGDINSTFFLRQRIEESQKELVKITEHRINGLQPLVNKICGSLHLPYPQLRTADDTSQAAYLIGTGIIEINRNILLEDQPLSDELMSSLLHEINHMAQDVLVIRMIADDIKLVFGQHSQLLMDLWERYAGGIGYAPDHMFLLAVLRLRGDKHLAPAERQRAMRLYQSSQVTKAANDQATVLNKRLDRMDESLVALNEGEYDYYLLSCLRNEDQLRNMFQSGKVPEILLQELNSCKTELERIIFYLIEHGILQPNRFRRDIISIAEQLLPTAEVDYVAGIVERIRALLIETLEEEQRATRRVLAQVKRAGYHEAECYTISDRVEVIVKALRKGWYQYRPSS